MFSSNVSWLSLTQQSDEISNQTKPYPPPLVQCPPRCKKVRSLHTLSIGHIPIFLTQCEKWCKKKKKVRSLQGVGVGHPGTGPGGGGRVLFSGKKNGGKQHPKMPNLVQYTLNDSLRINAGDWAGSRRWRVFMSRPSKCQYTSDRLESLAPELCPASSP